MAIGETVLGAVLAVVFERLASREVVNFFYRSKFDQSLVRKLETLMLAVGKLLLDAEQKHVSDHAVKQWLEKLQHWFYRAEEVVDQIATEALRCSLETKSPSKPQSSVTKVLNLFSASSPFLDTVTPDIREIVDMLESMLKQKDVLGLRELSDSRTPQSQRVQTTSLLEDPIVYGRDLEKEKIFEFVLSEKAETNMIGVVAIVGMGGAGKTTLAKMVYNDARVQETFDLKAWVCVSDQFDIVRVTRSITESVTPQQYSSSLDLNVLQNELSSKLRDKKFLLVLDDVWNENYEHWQTLRAPLCAGVNGSKIVITTRNEGVACTMCTHTPFLLKRLSDDDAWFLFSRHAFELGYLISSSNLEHIGRKIVKKCGGLPLAIKALGGLLRSKRDNKEWELILHSSLWDILQEKSKTCVIPALWLSYYHLPPHLKRCFSYCALFPKDYKIDRKKLVLLWMAENYVLPTHNERIEDVGEKYIDDLLSRSFLEPMGELHVTMHDLFNDLALDVSRNLKARPETVRRFAFVPDFDEGMAMFQTIHESKFLRTFLALDRPQGRVRSSYLPNTVSAVLVPRLSCLQVLSLSCYENLTLPESIGCLKQLRYLDVSGTKIKQLPESVSTLCSLQTLLLSDCRRLESLPTDMWRLGLLRHLDIRGATSLSHMPEHMSKLKYLQTLTDFVVGKNVGSDIEELRELKQIRGKFAIRRLQNVSILGDAGAVDLNTMESIDDLELEFDCKENNDSNKDRYVLERLKPSSNVERLTIKNYAGTRFPSWLDPGFASFGKMEFLCVSDCQYCFTLPALGLSPSLKKLKIVGMDYVTEVGPEFYGHNSNDPFPALESLSFVNMKGWERWSNPEGNPACFPRLKELFLSECPKLKGDLPKLVTLSSMTVLSIQGCGSLKSLANVQLPPTLKSLKIEGCKVMEYLPEGMGLLTHLQKLVLWRCPCLTWVSGNDLPTSLSYLWVYNCERWEFPIPTERMHQYTSLERLYIQNACSHLVSFPLGIFPNLRSLRFDGCKGLEEMYISEGINYNNLASLAYLDIEGCPELEMIGKDTGRGEATLLPAPNLTYLAIRKCEKVKALLIEMEGDVLLPKLRQLHFDKPISSKMTSERALSLSRSLFRLSCLQKLSVGRLEVERFPDADEDWGSLPTSLIELRIYNCPKLRKFDGKALQSLKHLRKLSFSNCPKLESWSEEGLPPSLGCLSLSKCPMMEERCQPEKGQYWPYIHHISSIWINDRWVTDP